jgi:hypothetical protein
LILVIIELTSRDLPPSFFYCLASPFNSLFFTYSYFFKGFSDSDDDDEEEDHEEEDEDEEEDLISRMVRLPKSLVFSAFLITFCCFSLVSASLDCLTGTPKRDSEDLSAGEMFCWISLSTTD